MSCYRIRRILNPKPIEKRGDFDKPYLRVACGQCPECRKKRSNDWFVRAFFELKYSDYKSQFFVSLDFDNEHLPLYNCITHKINDPTDRRSYMFNAHLNPQIKPCFDNEQMKLFFKRLRNRGYNFRYFYSSEYGGMLHRPHYHVIFLFNEKHEDAVFFKDVEECWPNGLHEDVRRKDSVKGSTFEALRYVVDYATKDISFDVDRYEENFPRRFCSRVQSSGSFGYQALEFGDITVDMIVNRDPVYLPIGDNGANVAFEIPRYYEMHALYDTVYHHVSRRTEYIKNQQGIEADILRHNRCYDYFIKSLYSSRLDKPSMAVRERFARLFPDSILNFMTWHEIVDIVNPFGYDFRNFAWYLPFFNRRDKVYGTDNHYSLALDSENTVSCWFFRERINIPNIELFNQVNVLYEFILESKCRSKDYIASFKLIEDSKKRALNKLRKNPQKLAYLKRVNYDFFQLKPSKFIPEEIDISVKSSHRVRRRNRAVESIRLQRELKNYSDWRHVLANGESGDYCLGYLHILEKDVPFELRNTPF